MVKYEDMLRDGVWYNSNLYLEDDIIRMSKDKVSTNPDYFSKMFETLHEMDIRKENCIL